MENYSEGLATGMALTQGNGYNNGGLGLGNGFLADIIGLVAVAGIFGLGNFGGNGAFGGGRGGVCATQADIRAAVDQQTLISKLDQQTYGLADSTYALNNTINSNFRSLDNAICTLGYQNQAGVNSIAHQISDCCCATQRAIDSVNYNMAKNTCDIIRSNQDGIRSILDYLSSEKISALQAENAGLKAQISNDRQSAYIVNALSPKCPQPAYVVQPPQEVTFPTNCCGNVAYANFGGGCNAL